MIKHFFNESVIDVITEQINLKITESLKNDGQRLTQAKNALEGLQTARSNLIHTLEEIGYNESLADRLNALERQISGYEALIEAEQKQKAQIKVTKNDVVEKIRELKKIMQNPVNIDSTKMVLRQYIDKVEISNNFGSLSIVGVKS